MGTKRQERADAAKMTVQETANKNQHDRENQVRWEKVFMEA